MKPAIDSEKSRAYVVYSEFGPSLRIPRFDRLVAEFPQAGSPAINEWLKNFKEMDAAIWKLAEEGGRTNIRRNDFLKSFSSVYPWLDEPGLQRAWFLCTYYIWHEGYGGFRN
jgi:hypothetical protein